MGHYSTWPTSPRRMWPSHLPQPHSDMPILLFLSLPHICFTKVSPILSSDINWYITFFHKYISWDRSPSDNILYFFSHLNFHYWSIINVKLPNNHLLNNTFKGLKRLYKITQYVENVMLYIAMFCCFKIYQLLYVGLYQPKNTTTTWNF